MKVFELLDELELLLIVILLLLLGLLELLNILLEKLRQTVRLWRQVCGRRPTTEQATHASQTNPEAPGEVSLNIPDVRSPQASASP
ncbi:hypothetical protein [Streptomyces sp. NPDC051452]|uniref:hypothetical protein n=1 Tax=Streptomyces sp. NPDC051452 TaxID=3365654 RepID=UPI0037ABBEA3